MKQYFFVGTYTEPILFGTGQIFQGKGEGLYLCSFEDGIICVENLLHLQNPSFFCVDEKRKKIYAVNETKRFQDHPGGGVTEITYDRTGAMRVERSCCTGGGDPCHIAVSPDGTFLAAANFAGGSVSTFPLSEDGEILQDRQLYQHTGRSTHPTRQQSPHPHSVIFAPHGRMMVPDLGTDQIWIYPYTIGGICTENPAVIPLNAGCGPRYGEYTPDRRNFYLINELASSVTHFACADSGTLHRRETVRTLSENFAGNSICSDLHITPDGKYLYASNRWDDSLTAFRIDAEHGTFSLAERISCCGKTPRNFCIEPNGDYLLVGNQESDTIVVFAIGPGGRLREVNQVKFPSPVCIRFFDFFS